MAAPLVLGVSGSSAADFQAALDAALAPLLAHEITSVAINVGDASQVNGVEYSAVITYNTGANPISAPYTAIVVEGRTAAEAAAAVTALMAADPTAFWSTVFANYEVNDGRRLKPYSATVFTNLAANSGNWSAGGAGGSAGSYVNPAAMPSTVGGYPAGTSFPTPRTWQQMFDGLLYPYLAPYFTAFGINGQANPLEIGATIPAAVTFGWSTAWPANVQANSIGIQDTTRSVALGTGLANTGSYVVTMPGGSITYNVPASHNFQISGTDIHSAIFTRNATYSWLWRLYYGQNASNVLTGAQVAGLAGSTLANGYPGSYACGATGYKFICFANSVGGQINSVTDPSTGFPVAMVTAGIDPAYSNVDGGGFSYALVSVTNVNGVTTAYRVYRTAYSLGGALTMVVA